MSTVELTRETDGPGLVAALAEHGLDGRARRRGHDHLAVQVEDCDEARARPRDRGLARAAAAAVRPGADRRLHVRGLAACGLEPYTAPWPRSARRPTTSRSRSRRRSSPARSRPGTVLRQEQLSEQYQVSRTPVREALRRLAALGLVSFVPNRGVRVRTLSPRGAARGVPRPGRAREPRHRAGDAADHRGGPGGARRGRAAVRRADARAAAARPRGHPGRRARRELGAREPRLPRRDLRSRRRARSSSGWRRAPAGASSRTSSGPPGSTSTTSTSRTTSSTGRSARRSPPAAPRAPGCSPASTSSPRAGCSRRSSSRCGTARRASCAPRSCASGGRTRSPDEGLGSIAVQPSTRRRT